jgi:hypothetical protein
LQAQQERGRAWAALNFLYPLDEHPSMEGHS